MKVITKATFDNTYCFNSDTWESNTMAIEFYCIDPSIPAAQVPSATPPSLVHSEAVLQTPPPLKSVDLNEQPLKEIVDTF